MVREPDVTMQPTLQDNQLMSKHRVLGFKPQLRLEWRGQDGQNETKQPDHSASLGAFFTSSTRIRFSVHTDQASANRHYWRHEGPRMGVSCQLWNIRDKIREVDDFIAPDRQATIGEAHPELIFRKLGHPLRLEGKKSALGRDQRIKLLADRGFVKLSKWLTQRYGTGIGRDDLIDACACAVAARDSNARLGGDEVDVRGLRMEINY
jgi:predicted RNase H-like nuclease